MNKSLISILLVVFLAVISGCADTGSGDGNGNSNTPSYDISSIPEDKTPIELIKQQDSYGNYYTEPKDVTITNPRTEAGQYYPILISTAMGLNGEADLSEYGFGTVKGIAYETKFGSSSSNSNLVFGESGRDMYDLNGVTPLEAKGKGTYHVQITEWSGAIPNEGKLVIAFLTEAEANNYIPNNDNIVLSPDGETMTYNPKFLDNTIVDDLNKLGALRQYTFTVK